MSVYNAEEYPQNGTSLEAEPQLSEVAQRLSLVRLESNVNLQFRALADTYPYDAPFEDPLSEDDVDLLIDFASDPKASTSLLVRAQAFNRAVDAILTQEWGDDATLQQELDEFVLPDLRAKSPIIRRPILRYWDSEGGDVAQDPSSSYQPYRLAARKLARRDGLDEDLIVTAWSDWGESDDIDQHDDNIPTMALLLLENLSQKIASYDHGDESHQFSRFTKLVPLALEIQEATYSAGQKNVVDIAPSEIQDMKVDSEEIREFLCHKELAEPYVKEFERLSKAAKSLPDFFPEQYRTGVAAGATALFNDAMYAVKAHLDNGSRTKTILPRERIMSLDLQGDEPLMLLESITSSIRALHSAMTDPNMGTTAVGASRGFQIYRLWKGGASGSNTAVYIRPWGAGAFDRAFEFGRESKGVEASISYVVDPTLEPNEISKVGKTKGSQSDNRISIRLDREGVLLSDWGKIGSLSDPIQEQGVLSLDIGSIVGRDDWLGTKIGRFLAWGNVLRTKRLERSGLPNHSIESLNHSVEYFTPDDGTAHTFAQAALMLQCELDAKRLNRKQLAERLAGTRVVGVAHNTK